ncbi:hypothetical protein C2E20_7335 [Micractinium conductrix]|uniref:Uncharacterized protein n=1 Tax=Micractinium conductrix TaxID=554055 RepID=A0A2P6V519_9CHLO|nr:hypothetical protein C2E20_7335 [Micractinium conductrix]|eukprot:PSC69179.1 hypothetical protein C2E20_7335 [Micractinium conductrix]
MAQPTALRRRCAALCAAAVPGALWRCLRAVAGAGRATDMRRWRPDLSTVYPRLEVPWIVELSPWAPSDEAPAPGGGLASQGEAPYSGRLEHLCLQGSIDYKRRDFDAVFVAASHPAVLAQLRARNESVLLVGSYQEYMGRKLEIPEQLVPHDYFDMLSRCRAMLTSFAQEHYVINITSTTVAVALQVGTPLLTEQRVLDTYGYFPSDAAFAYTLPGTTAHDSAAMGAALGREQSQQMERASAELAAAAAAAEQPAAVVATAATAEQPTVAAEELPAAAATEQPAAAAANKPASAAPAAEQPAVAAAAATRRRLGEEAAAVEEQGAAQAAAAAAAGEADGAGAAAEVEPPRAGSYAAAMLAAFDDEACRAAHTATWRAKQEVMRHNADAAAQVLRETAALAAAAAARASA